MNVLEHLREPQRALREIARTLAPDGLVVIAVPDGSSLSDRLFRAYYRTMHSPRQPGYDPHVQCLRSQDVERLAANAGLRVLERVTISESFAWLHKHPWLRRLLTKTFAAGRRIARGTAVTGAGGRWRIVTRSSAAKGACVPWRRGAFFCARCKDPPTRRHQWHVPSAPVGRGMEFPT